MDSIFYKKGFTLIELIIVIAIIGILAAVAIRIFPNMQENAQIKADAMTVAQIKNAYSIYINGSGDRSEVSIKIPNDPNKSYSTTASICSKIRYNNVDYGPYLSQIPNTQHKPEINKGWQIDITSGGEVTVGYSK